MKRYLLSVCFVSVCVSMAACTMEDGIVVQYACLNDHSESAQPSDFTSNRCHESYACEEVARPAQFADSDARYDICYFCGDKAQKFCDGKCIGLDETCAGPCTGDVCSEDGRTLVVCNPDGSTKDITCNFGCENNACLESCIESCKDENVLLQCQKDGSKKEMACPYGCDLSKNVCKGECEDGEFKCEGNLLLKCSNGRFSGGEECIDTVCSAEDGKCNACRKDELLNVNDSDVNVCIPKCTKDSCDVGLVCGVETGECEKCETGHYDAESKSCVDDSLTSCGWDDQSSAPKDCTSLKNVSEAVCEEGACVVLSCKSSYHKTESGDGCEADTSTSCGSVDKNCMKIENVMSADCENGACVIKKCNDNFSYLGSACVAANEAISISGNFANIPFDSSRTGEVVINMEGDEFDVEMVLQDSEGKDWSDDGINIQYGETVAKRIIGLKYQKGVDLKFEIVTGKSENTLPLKNYFDDVKLVVTVNSEAQGPKKSISYRSMKDITTKPTKEFVTSPESETMKLPAGRYEITLFGAGGAGGEYSRGGNGGIARGYLTLDEVTDVIVYRGTTGRKCQDRIVCHGNNGSANGSTSDYACLTYGFGGGGATDLRIGKDDYAHRVIVAGGGGGSTYGKDGNGGKGGSAGLDVTDTRGGNGKPKSGAAKALGGGNDDCRGCRFGEAAAGAKKGELSGGGGGGWFSGMSGVQRHESGAGGSGFILSAKTYTDYVEYLQSVGEGANALDRKYIMEPLPIADVKSIAASENYNGYYWIKVVPPEN